MNMIHAILKHIANVLIAFSTALVLFLLIIIASDIVGRIFFNHPIRGATEIVTIGIVAVVFASLPFAVINRRMARVDVIAILLERRFPMFANVLETIFDLIGAILMLLLSYALYHDFLDVYQLGDYIGTLGDFTAPVWPVRLIQLIGAMITACAFVDHIIQRGRRLNSSHV
jgi:TRAP-type C4-dicarboxylate transport system permease small subunit